MNIEPTQPTVKNPPDKVAGDDPATTTIWKEHITDDQYLGRGIREEKSGAGS